MSRAATAEHHEEIVAVGSRMLRERGIAGTSVADIMQAARSYAWRVLPLIEKFSAAQTGTPAERRANAVKLFITLVGSVVVARAVGSSELREEILFAGRNANPVD